jgi:single-strand selective monofunctional uracil DNA glycosylase
VNAHRTRETGTARGDTVDPLVRAAARLRDRTAVMTFAPPVAYVYHPLQYAWEPHEAYLRRYGRGRKRVIFVGMNPGPFGMAQTGVPFGEIAIVRDWLKIDGKVGHPPREHPKRPIQGFDCHRSEVSGRRLWGFFRAQYGTPEAFFKHHFVVNYCPLVFMEESGRNRTPDQLPASEREPLFEVCDEHVREVARILEPQWMLGIGAFAKRRLDRALAGMDIKIGLLPHPSPASPAANRDWEGPVKEILVRKGLL